MRDIHVVFFEGAFIEQHLDAFARRQLALAVLGVDPSLAAAKRGAVAPVLQNRNDFSHPIAPISWIPIS
ncbi:hypothetical protein D9M72_500180 [compost metagenome]